ncbi:MAG: hypothetical protein Q9175_001487 [Cornicularia normoerica]
MDVNEGKNADFTKSTGHSAITIMDTMDVNEGKNADFTKSTGHSATIENIKGKDPMDDLVASMKSFGMSESVTEFRAYIPSTWPIKQNMYVGMDTSPERYLENLYLLGLAWVRKVQHIARLTLNSPNGPIWPTEVEPMALVLFEYLKRQRLHWASIPDRADFADELDFVWRENPPWLPPRHSIFTPIWEHVTGMARTWAWNWHNEVRKQGAPEAVWKPEDRKLRSRFYQNKASAARHHHILAQQRVPTIAQHIRTNKFYQVGDDETACERPQSAPRCRNKCHHAEYAHTLKRLKKKHGLIRAPGVEPENEYGGIE